jgi:hypothetical protein
VELDYHGIGIIGHFELFVVTCLDGRPNKNGLGSMNIWRYETTVDFSGRKLRSLFDCAEHLGTQLMLVLPDDTLKDQEFVELILPHTFSTEIRLAWPGTQLYSKEGKRVCIAPTSADAIAVLRNGPNELWNWLHPEYPEDLAFLRQDRTAWFISIHHERDAYFELSEHEAAKVERFLGSGSLSLTDPVPLPLPTY